MLVFGQITKDHYHQCIMYQSRLIGILLLQSLTQHVRGLNLGTFFPKYRYAIERYIMTGYGYAWKSCDILTVGSKYPTLSHDNAILDMDVKNLGKFDISTTLSSAYCLLLVSHVDDIKTLAAILEFGWTAIQHKRLGMVLTLGNNMTLDGLKNTTKLPFVIASQQGNDTEQFLCPVVGRLEPVLQSVMCELSLTEYKSKEIRVSLWPYMAPYQSFGNDGKVVGVDIKLVKLLEDKMKFKANITISSPFDIYNLVCKLHIIYGYQATT